MDTLTDERLSREFKVTKKALDELKIIIDKNDKNYDIAIKIVDTATRYYQDAIYFDKKKDKASAFGALNYAYGWLDAGKEMNLFEKTKHV